MDKITYSDAKKFTSPNPLTIICTQTPEGYTNLATVAWWTYLSSDPGMIGFAMGKGSYSGELVRQNKKVVLAMPGIGLEGVVLSCGTVSGRAKNKAEDFDIELKDIPECEIQIPANSRLAMECSLVNTVEAGNHFFYICNVENIYADEAVEALFVWSGDDAGFLRGAK